MRMLIVWLLTRRSLGAALIRGGHPQSGLSLVFISLGLDGEVPDHSMLSKNCHAAFARERPSAQAGLSRPLPAARRMAERRGRRGAKPWRSTPVHNRGRRASTAKRRQGRRSSSDFDARSPNICRSSMMRRSWATPVELQVISPTDPAARYTASANLGRCCCAHPDNPLAIDLKHAVIVDVEATTTIRQAEVGAAKTSRSTARLNSSTSPHRAWSPMGLRLGRDGPAGWWTRARDRNRT